jgi:transposase InsO family protein
MRAVGYAVESICAVLREQGVQVAARTYRAWKKRLPALRTIEDARITDALRSLKVPDAKGRPRPEIIYGRRKMTQWLRRSGFPEASKHTVDRLMRDEGMNGLVRGRKTRTTVPGKDGRRAGDLLNPDFTAPAPNQIWVTDFTYVPVYSGFVYVALVIDLYSRAIVGWETSAIKDTAFVEHCLRMAFVAAGADRPARAGGTDPSFRCGQPIYLHPVHRHTGPGGPAAVHWQRR